MYANVDAIRQCNYMLGSNPITGLIGWLYEAFVLSGDPVARFFNVAYDSARFALIQVRDLVRYFLVDWNRRVDPVWVVEMMSGTIALLLALWMITRPHGKPHYHMLVWEITIPAMFWFVLITWLGTVQISAAICFGRKARAFGCLSAALVWIFITIVLWIRSGFVALQPFLIGLDIACVAATAAYFYGPADHGSTNTEVSSR